MENFSVERAEPYYPGDDQPLIGFTLPYTDMVARFGPAHRLTDAGDNEPGPAEYWSFRFPCGLHTFITYHRDAPPAPGGTVTASSPDITHILQHLPITDCVFWRLDHDEADLYRKKYGTPSDACSLLTEQPKRAIISISRMRIVALVLLLAIAGIIFWRYPRLSAEPYQVFISPDEQHRLEVFTYSSWLPAISMPGQSGDASGRVFLRDKHGTTLKTMPIGMVQNVTDPEWTDRKVEIWAVLDWSW